MVLRCPKCSKLEFYGRPQVLGHLVVCSRCDTPFAWEQMDELERPDLKNMNRDTEKETSR